MSYCLKYALFLSFFMISIPSAQAANRVDFRISKMHGFYLFLQTISGKPHQSEVIFRLFEKSKFNTPENQKLILDLRSAEESMPGFDFNGFPQSRRAGADVDLLISIQSIFAKDLNDLSQRAIGMLPTADHTQFFGAAKKLLPVYEQLIWNASLAKLEAYRLKLSKMADQAKLDSLFTQAAHFYRAKWPADQSFVIGLYPTPGNHGSTVSQSLGAAESVGVLLSDNDYAGTVGVIFHELCHSLYLSQPIEFQHELEKMFLSHPSPYASHAYHLLNEGLATALGNGWAYEAAARKPDLNNWYNDPYINGFSKAIYPVVLEYLKSHRSLDANFIDQTIIRTEKAIPNSLYDYANLFQWIDVLGDGKLISKSVLRQSSFRKIFRVNSWNAEQPISDPNSLQKISESDRTVLVIYTSDERRQLDALAMKIPFLKNHLKALKAKNQNYLYSVLDEKGRAFVFAQVSTPADLDLAFQHLKKNAQINVKNPMFIFADETPK